VVRVFTLRVVGQRNLHEGFGRLVFLSLAF
jgi:hypothetical protein